MGYLKFSVEEFLEVAELNQFSKFLVEDGWKKSLLQSTYGFGIIRTKNDSLFSNFKIQAGTNPKTIKLSEDSYALDSNGNLIYKAAEDNVDISGLIEGNWYWVKISHQFSSLEVGIVNIDANGNLTGSGTEFLSKLRGQPNFPSKIRLEGSTLNTLEYEVTQVISDTNAILSGSFQAETGLKLVIIGTFSPGTVPSTQDKEIFQYDSNSLSLVPEAVLNTAPAKSAGTEFYIARVKYNGSVVTIEDKRTEFWQLKGDYRISQMPVSNNPLIGVEAVKFNSTFSTRESNIVEVAWGFRSSNWTVNSSLSKITISGGLGGKYKSTSDFISGDFDGWRIYRKNGSYSKIVQSVKAGSQINLILDVLNPDDFTNGDEVIVVPDAEFIQIQVNDDGDFSDSGADSEIELVRNVFDFPINLGICKLFLLAPHSPTYSYNLKYCYNNFGNCSEFVQLPDDSVGYYTEASFDDNGILNSNPINVFRHPYVGDDVAGYIELIQASTSFRNTIDFINLGDVLGVTHRTLNNLSPIVTLQVGVDKQVQIIDGIIGDILTTDNVINLSRSSAKNGNKFILIFKCNINPDIFSLTINDNYVNTGSKGTIFRTLSATDYAYIATTNGQLSLEFIYDGSKWNPTVLEEDKANKTQLLLRSTSAVGPTTYLTPGIDTVMLSLTPSATLGSSKMKYTFMGYLANDVEDTAIIKIKRAGTTIATTKTTVPTGGQANFCLVWVDTYTANNSITATISPTADGGDVNNYILICEAMDAQ